MAMTRFSNSSIANGFPKYQKFWDQSSFVLPVQSNLTMWYDASNTSSLTLSGSNVTQWNDLSGNGRHATGSSGSYPTYTSGALNGKAAIDFGVSSAARLIITNPITYSTKTFHFFAVVKTRQESPTDYSAIIGTYLYPTSTTGNLAWSFPGNGNVGGSQQMLCGSVAWGPNGTKTDYSASQFYNVNASGNSGTIAFRAVRADDGGGSFGSTISTTTNALGWQEGQTYGGNVTIAEFIAYSSPLSTTDRNAVENYLFAKWGV